jgi:hypothetical protein
MSKASAALPARIPGTGRLDLKRGRRRNLGISAHGHDLRQCLCAAADGPLPERLERELRGARLHRRAAADAFRRWPGVAGDGARLPIRLLESGPAGGGLATALFGELAGKKDVISFDMGGTTAKACMIEDGRAEIAPMLEAGRVHRFARAPACRSRRRSST